jgi:hypothetical protein
VSADESLNEFINDILQKSNIKREDVSVTVVGPLPDQEENEENEVRHESLDYDPLVGFAGIVFNPSAHQQAANVQKDATEKSQSQAHVSFANAQARRSSDAFEKQKAQHESNEFVPKDVNQTQEDVSKIVEDAAKIAYQIQSDQQKSYAGNNEAQQNENSQQDQDVLVPIKVSAEKNYLTQEKSADKYASNQNEEPQNVLIETAKYIENQTAAFKDYLHGSAQQQDDSNNYSYNAKAS